MRVDRRAGLAAAATILLAWQATLAAPSDDGADQALVADQDHAAGLAALKGGDPAAALPRFREALKRFPDSANLHNDLGFSYRGVGQLDKAFEHYKRALAIDPRHRSAHEYIGEAYLMAGDLPNAEKHLAALRGICLLPCEEQRDLEKAIASHKAKSTPK
jgi:Flp pilus assembly protein TadD